MAFALANGLSPEMDTSQVTLETTVTPEVRQQLSGADLDPHAGGGGVMQRMFDWDKEFEAVPDADKWRWIVYCTIAGMPIYSMLGAVRNLGKPDPYQKA